MKTENKQYKLKRWYPSLDERLEVGDIGDRYLLEFGNETKEDRFSVLKGGTLIYIPIQELHPDFWELIEENKPKPLFITEDGVEVYDIDSLVFIVKDDFKKSQRFALAFKQNKNDMKSFYHEANADEYIWRNKPVFSYNDIKKYQSGGEGVWYDIKTIAKRRSKE